MNVHRVVVLSQNGETPQPTSFESSGGGSPHFKSNRVYKRVSVRGSGSDTNATRMSWLRKSELPPGARISKVTLAGL